MNSVPPTRTGVSFPGIAYQWLGWVFGMERGNPLPFTIARRQRFNALTNSLNNLIRDVVNDV